MAGRRGYHLGFRDHRVGLEFERGECLARRQTCLDTPIMQTTRQLRNIPQALAIGGKFPGRFCGTVAF
jgi:hypothetical protein